MKLLVVSDFHLGRGKFFKNGQVNILEDFFEDELFFDFCDYYSSGEYLDQEVSLVLNGDILNLIQIDNDGVFTHIIDEAHTINSLKKIYDGHQKFFKALEIFASKPKKEVIYIIGNHDAPMAFQGAQKYFAELVGCDINFCFEYDSYGVHIEHGHRFEKINTVPMRHYFQEGPNGKEILNLPWGSLFCIFVLPVLKKERPSIDHVRPLNSYIKWSLLHDFGFFVYMCKKVFTYLWESNSDIFVKQNKNFKTTLHILKQITIYPRYSKKAKSILKAKRHVHTVVMGHTHLLEWRRFPEGKYYFNTGTWNAIPSIDLGLHEESQKLTYCILDVNTKYKNLNKGGIATWKGKWKPFIDEINI